MDENMEVEVGIATPYLTVQKLFPLRLDGRHLGFGS